MASKGVRVGVARIFVQGPTAAVVRMWHRARVEKGDSAGGEARKHHGWRAGAMQGQTCCGKGAGARMMSQQ